MSTELPHPDDAEFAAIRADLARLFITHKAALGLGDWSDAEIIARTSDITATLIGLYMHATQHSDEAWLARHDWFRVACARLLDDQCATPLDA